MGAWAMIRASGPAGKADRLFPRAERLAWGLILLGIFGFVAALATGQPAVAWRAYLVNFLLFSAIAQGALAVSAMASTVRVESSSLPQLAEAFSAFFPVSLLLFLGLIPGAAHVFPWLGSEFGGGKDLWLSLPFLFSRDLAALAVLYGLGLWYLYYSLWFRLGGSGTGSGLRAGLARLWERRGADAAIYASRRYVFGVLYLVAYAFVLTLVAFDLVMAAEPHWYSTLFGAYSFVKALYVGIGALIILAAALHMGRSVRFRLADWEAIDIGKLLLAFCLLWADFFYCQLVVIWYGNIPEETGYVITRTVMAPWSALSGTVFAVGFVLPFTVLLNRRVKTLPAAMTGLCCAVIAGMWLEHYLLLAPALGAGQVAASLPTWADVLVSLAFLGLLIRVVLVYLNHFPETLEPAAAGQGEPSGGG